MFGIAFQVGMGEEAGFAGGIVATAMSMKATVNGTGRGVSRGVIARLSDRRGRKRCLVLVCGVLGLSPHGILRSAALESLPLFLLLSSSSGFGGGAVLPMFAAMTADCSGESNNASRHGLVYGSELGSGLLGAGTGKAVMDNRGHGGAFTLAGSVSLFAACVALFPGPPGRATPRNLTPGPRPVSRHADRDRTRYGGRPAGASRPGVRRGRCAGGRGAAGHLRDSPQSPHLSRRECRCALDLRANTSESTGLSCSACQWWARRWPRSRVTPEMKRR